MAMQKSLFKKYLRISVTIILVSFLLLGTMLIMFISRYWQDEKRGLLSTNATGVAELAATMSVPDSDGVYTISVDRMKSFVNVFSATINADIFMAGNDGTVMLSSDMHNSEALMGGKVPQAIVNRALTATGYVGTTDLGGLYDHTCYVVGKPIILNINGTAAVGGVVFAVSDMAELYSFRMDVLRIFLFAALGALLISIFMVGLFTYNMMRPLRDMAAAARCFGAGDFSHRVPVTSQDEIGQLAVAFNNMAASLASSEGTRRSFIANVSHELKTPMTTIAGFIDGILDGTIPAEQQNHYLKIVSDEVKRLSRLVKTMLDLSRIDNGELHMNVQRFDLTATVLKALLTFEKKIDEKHIEVTGLEDAQSQFVDGDPDMIHQVVYNLIENAVKFVNENGYIELHVEERPDRNVVRIKNSGQGIPADEIGMIFEKFYKTDKSRSKDRLGMGLGLYIVKTIVKQHGGDITVSSVEGEYCQFEFWIPKQKKNELAKNEKKKDSKR